VIYPALQQSNYWRDSVKSMEMRLAELGIRYDLQKFYSRPSGDFRLQMKQLADALKTNPDYIALSVDDDNMIRAISSVLTRGKPKIIVQNLTTPLKQWDQTPPMMYVGFDHQEGAGIIADHYSSVFPAGANYILLYGAQGSVSTLRGDSFENYANYRGFKPVAKFYTDFSAEKAYNAVVGALKKHPETNFIYACSTDVAIGASKALAENGLSGKVLVNGWGGTLNELELIKKNMLDFTVMRINDDNGVAIAEAVKMDISGESDSIPKIFSGEMLIVTKEMDNQVIDQLIERALRFSSKNQ
jgi:autoinducer 2-binding protein LuxP